MISYQGKDYKSQMELCKAFHFKYSAFVNRKYGKFWDIERIFKTPLSHRKKPHRDHLGNKYDSFLAMCNAYKISRYAVRFRLKTGWNLESALTEPVTRIKRSAEVYNRCHIKK